MSSELSRLSRAQAVEKFRPGVPALDSVALSDLEDQLRRDAIAKINLPIDKSAFQDLSDQYGVCIDEHGALLNWTAGSFNKDGVPEDGHVQKELEFNPAGMQISDPKNLFHFNGTLLNKWNNESTLAMPRDFREFMDRGIELRHELTNSARMLIDELDGSYRGIRELTFPGELGSTTLRLLRYDGYDTHDSEGKLVVEQDAQVAKPHYDRGLMTIQAYSSAPGFWRQQEGNRGPGKPKEYPPHGVGESQVFFGTGFRVIYGRDSPIQRLYHGVDRIFDESASYIPPRTAAILFVDPPLVNLEIKSTDTQPDRVDQENLNV